MKVFLYLEINCGERPAGSAGMTKPYFPFSAIRARLSIFFLVFPLPCSILDFKKP